MASSGVRSKEAGNDMLILCLSDVVNLNFNTQLHLFFLHPQRKKKSENVRIGKSQVVREISKHAVRRARLGNKSQNRYTIEMCPIHDHVIVFFFASVGNKTKTSSHHFSREEKFHEKKRSFTKLNFSTQRVNQFKSPHNSKSTPSNHPFSLP